MDVCYFFACCVSLLFIPTVSFAKVDPCFSSWENRLGVMVELRPSRLAGFREARLSDGNVIFIDKQCSKIFVGEVIEREDIFSGQSTDRVDRQRIDLSKLIAVGKPQRDAWIFGVNESDLSKFAAEMFTNGSRFESYFLMIASSSKQSACSAKSSSFEDLSAAAKKCDVPASVYLGLFGGRIPFAVDSVGRKFDVEDWGKFLAKTH